MRRIFLLACLAVLPVVVVQAAPAPGSPDPSLLSRRAVSSADGGYCSQAGDVWRCRQFAATAYSEPSGRYLETRAWFDQWRNWLNGYATRHIECTVERLALTVTPQRAHVQATLDPASESCTSYGERVTWDPETGEVTYEPWPFTEPVVLEADLLNPRYQNRRVTSVTYTDNETGESHRENCHGGDGYRLYGGGFTVLGLYRAFGPDDADGSFYYDTCGTRIQ